MTVISIVIQTFAIKVIMLILITNTTHNHTNIKYLLVNINLICASVCFFLYVIIIFKASENLVTDKDKLSRTVRTNEYDLPTVKAGDDVNSHTVKQNNYDAKFLIDAIESPFKCKLIRQIYILFILNVIF